MDRKNFVVLVDFNGHDLTSLNGQVSTADKIEAHLKGLMHRAVSVFIFNDKLEILLQKRASDKYHSPNKWSNTCCTHPLPGEAPLVSAQRRLKEEMQLQTSLTEAFTFSYKANVGNNLIENEFDHVFFGDSNNIPNPDPTEVSDWNWMSIAELAQELVKYPEKYSPWLRQCFNKVVELKSPQKTEIWTF
jgi:isopentenyl-diphosphate delta-isomerase